MIGVGLLGAGSIGSIHFDGYRDLTCAKVVAVADANREAANRLAEACGATAYYDISDLLTDGRVDMVDVCIPTFLHERAVVGAAEAGKHVLCEKPIALGLESADRMIAAVRASGVKAMVAQVMRFWPQYVMIKDLLDRGELGRPLAAVAERLSAPKWGWFKDPTLSGGAVLDIHIHDLDFFYYLFGEPSSVYALGLRSQTGGWEHVMTSLDFGSVKAVAEGSYLMPEGYPFLQSIRVLGDKASVEYRSQGEVVERAAEDAGFSLCRPGEPPMALEAPEVDGYAAEIEYFVSCVKDDRESEIATFEEARTVLRLALAATTSLKTGEVVTL